jgi:hypothetical protein
LIGFGGWVEAEAFIARWRGSGGHERANAQPFLLGLCALLGVEAPDPARTDYGFEHRVEHVEGDGTRWTGFIDLYRKGAFVLEAKQGVDPSAGPAPPLAPAAPSRRRGHGVRGTATHANAMVAARLQAEAYARAVAAEDGWPLFLIVVDVGHAIELYADFSRTGSNYVQFPDANGFRIRLDDLAKLEVRERLSQLWHDPGALDPARRAARVTREIADRLAALGRRLEARHSPASVAEFQMRCLFTMFAEDVKLIPGDCFTALLRDVRPTPHKFQPLVTRLWEDMRSGSAFSAVARDRLLRFNGGLFENADALALDGEEIDLLIDAASRDWRDVEPAIFGTLLERALAPDERHKLGAHYTPRAYVERLVLPTVIEPLRAEWAMVQASAEQALVDGHEADALAEVERFRDRLCTIRVLDPACGSGNFLYVTMEHMKRLEGEVLDLMRRLGRRQEELHLSDRSVGPNQFLGLEVNPRAAAIAELVLWIGHLQWHLRTHGDAMPAEPVLRRYGTIEWRDAVLAWDREELARDGSGRVLTRWDGVTTRVHAVTGREVPDEAAQVPIRRYVAPRPAAWPKADYIVGNPPFIGPGRMRQTLGDGYVEALRAAYPDVPDSADYVLYWWHRAAQAVAEGGAARFGLITTNSLGQTFARRVVARHLDARRPVSLAYAIADHPWIDAADGAAVRIAMTVGVPGTSPGRLLTVLDEQPGEHGEVAVTLAERTGRILADLTIGPAVLNAVELRANAGICSPGVKLHGSGFIVTPEEARALGLGTIPGLERHIRPYRNGRDLTARPRGVMVIDLFGLSEEEVRQQYPAVWQHVADRVRPERLHNNRATYRDNWWIFGEPRKDLRPALSGLPRYIATVETAKHRVFQFLDAAILPDNRLVVIASDDAAIFALLSSRVHATWALAAGGTLEDRPVYNKTRCFDAFSFPAHDGASLKRLRGLGDELDGHLASRLAADADLSLTAIYNVKAKLDAGQALDPKEREVHERGLVGVLHEIHRAIDSATAAAYGWPIDLSDTEVLERLVSLNRMRAIEERAGLVRHLRPTHQASLTPAQTALSVEAGKAAAIAAKPHPWPRERREQIQLVRDALLAAGEPIAVPALARRFKGARTERVRDLLETLTALGLARSNGERYAG